MKPNPDKSDKGNLREVASVFLKLGLIGFGGPAAHIAMMQREVVVKRKWLSEQYFLDLIGATNLIPGPNSTEMAIHLGHERAGWKGLIVAGSCFITPAVLITGLLAWLYSRYGQLPEVEPFLYGIKPAIISIILGAVYPLLIKSLKSVSLGVIGLAALLLWLWGISELFVMLGAGLCGLLFVWTRWRGRDTISGVFPVALFQLSNIAAADISVTNLFFIFLKIGAVLYGSGYVLFAFIDTEIVARGLLSQQQLIDAIAVGQFTPGPVFSSVTFVGYQLKGFWGAVASTVGVFLPSFLFVALLNPFVKRMRKSRLFAAFLDAVNVASVAVILGVCYELGREVLVDWRTIAIAAVSVIVTFRFSRVNSALVVVGGSLFGYILSLF